MSASDCMSKSEQINTFFDNGYVRLGTFVAALIFCIGAVITATDFIKEDALWKNDIEHTVEEIQENKDDLKKLNDDMDAIGDKIDELTAPMIDGCENRCGPGWIKPGISIPIGVLIESMTCRESGFSRLLETGVFGRLQPCITCTRKERQPGHSQTAGCS